MIEYKKYVEVYDIVLKKLIEKYYFKKSYIKDFKVIEVVKLNKDKWIVKLERNI